jgi:Na+/phosphate symporter
MPKDGKVELTPESGKQGTYTESTELDENTMTTNEGRSAEDLKQGQLDQAYSHLEKIKEKPKLFSSEDIKKAEARIEKLEAELDALATKATNESLDEATVRRWQHYAGIK